MHLVSDKKYLPPIQVQDGSATATNFYRNPRYLRPLAKPGTLTPIAQDMSFEESSPNRPKMDVESLTTSYFKSRRNTTDLSKDFEQSMSRQKQRARHSILLVDHHNREKIRHMRTRAQSIY